MNVKLREKLNKGAIPFKEVLRNHYSQYPESKKIIQMRAKYHETLMDLRKTRKRLGFTLEQIEELSGIPKATISKIETGKRNATLLTLMSIAESMGKVLEVRLK